MRILLVTLIVSSALGVVAEAKDRWLVARSAHFTVVSNGGEGRAKSILEDLEQLRRLITEIFPSHKVDDAKPAVFYLFKNEKSMRPFQPTRDGKREDWAGMYRPTPLRNIVLIRADGRSDAARGMAFSQYMHLLGSYNDRGYPVWLSNGLSRFYGNTEIAGERASIGKMRQGDRRALGEFRSVPIRELFAVDYASDYYRDPGLRSLFDAQSWALVHYLLVGQHRENGPERLGRYVVMLREGRQPLLAFQEAMGKTLDEIDSDVSAYIRKSITQYIQVKLPPLEMSSDDFEITKLDDAAADAHLGGLYVATRYDAEAEATLSRSIEKNPDQVIAYEAMANLLDRQRKSVEASGFLERAIRNGSTNPYVHLRHAQIYVESRDGTETSLNGDATIPVMESLRFVLRQAPELTDAARLFGFLALFRDETREEAFRIVSEALRREPAKPSLLFMLGQLHAENGSYAAAGTIYRRLLERELDPGFTASVRRQLDFADARARVEAQRVAAEAAARAAGGDAVTGAAAPPPAEATEKTRTPLSDRIPRTEIVEVRGKLIRFDCSDGHRFIVAAGDLFYSLGIADLARVEILENGQNVGTRDFYCGPLDEDVVVRYLPVPGESSGKERSGRLVAVDFVGGR